MQYGITTEGTDFTEEMLADWRIRLWKAILFFVPRANPDIEPLYPLVRSWALELSDEGWPKREVGLDASGKPLFRAPDHRNTGFWTDMARRQFDQAGVEPISKAAFNELWSAAQSGG
jgi:hypothetical protein